MPSGRTRIGKTASGLEVTIAGSRAAPMTFPADTRPAPRVTLDVGTIEGAEDGAIESFKGIRFAAPPTGDWRWRAPRPVQPWTGVRQTTHFGADCMQTPFAEDMAPLTTQPAEDCLFL